MFFLKGFLSILPLFVQLFLPSVLSEDTTPETEESLFEIANQLCLEKTGYQPMEHNAYFRVEEAPVNGNVTLPCAFCGHTGEDLPRTWFWRKREVGAEEEELDMGLAPNLTENRIFTLPDNSLTIQQVTVNDSGLYYCRSVLEGDFTEFHFSLDVIQPEVAVYGVKKKLNDEADFQEYNEKVILKANQRLGTDEKLKKDLDKVVVKIVSEWDPWLPCDGCLGIRKRYAKCRLRPKLNEAKYPGIPEDKLSDREKLLLSSSILSCHSLDLAKWFPNLHSFTRTLPNHVKTLPCQDACLREQRMLHEAKYKLDFTMDERSSMSFLCPDADLRTKVVWRKQGSVIKPIGPPPKPEKTRKYKNPFEKKIKEFTFKHVFVDRMNVLQLCYVGEKETGVYTCYIDNKPVKAFNITVVTPEETLKERRYHFLLLCVYTCTLSGAIVVMGITWAVLNRRELFPRAALEEPDADASYVWLEAEKTQQGHKHKGHHTKEHLLKFIETDLGGFKTAKLGKEAQTKGKTKSVKKAAESHKPKTRASFKMMETDFGELKVSESEMEGKNWKKLNF